MSLNQGMTAAARELSAAARVTFATGAAVELDGGDVLAFSVEEGTDSALLPGAVLSARMTLDLNDGAGQWRPGGSLRGARPLVGATVELFVKLASQSLPCGVFIVTSVQAEERSGRIRLSGEDSIASELTAAFDDGLTYPATLASVWAHLVAQTRYVWSGTLPNGSAVIDAKPDWDGASLRRAAGWIAQAAGCFVRIGRAGGLEIVPCAGGTAEAISPDAYLSLTDGAHAFGPVNALSITPAGAEAATVYEDDGIAAGETISISGNPLYQSGAANLPLLAHGTLAQLAGLTLARAEFRWRGDPAVGVGTRIALTNTHGDVLSATVTRQTLRFDGGFSATCACETPEESGAGLVRAITPEGGVNAGALVGTVDGGLLAAGSVTAQAIAAQAITAEKLAAGAIGADKIAAGSITADKLAAGAVDAKSVAAVAAAFSELTAGNVAASALYAGFAHAMELRAGQISADSIAADSLAASIVNAVRLSAAAGAFSLADVQNLLANALVLEQGVAGSMTIANLAVTSANLLSATVGKLILPGTDGNYYELYIGAGGTVHAAEVELTDAEIAAGQTESGRPVASTQINAGWISGQTVQANEALFGEILAGALSAGQITAAEAMIASAAIPALYAASISAIGESIDLSANGTIQMILGRQGEAQRWFTFDDASGLTIRKPAWTDADGVQHAASIWSTVTDEAGYHIRRADMIEDVGAFERDGLTANAIQLGPDAIVARRTATGGWAWVEGE